MQTHTHNVNTSSLSATQTEVVSYLFDPLLLDCDTRIENDNMVMLKAQFYKYTDRKLGNTLVRLFECKITVC